MNSARNRRWLAVLAMLALAVGSLTACGDDDDDSDEPSYTASFEGDGGPGEGEIALVPASAEEDRFTVDVVAGGGFAEDAYGLAFRLTYDPQVIAFVEATAGDGLASSGVELIAMAHEREDGELVIGISRADTFSGVALESGDAVLRLAFEAVGPGETRVDFFEDHRDLVSDRLDPIEVADWIGGTATVR